MAVTKKARLSEPAPSPKPKKARPSLPAKNRKPAASDDESEYVQAAHPVLKVVPCARTLVNKGNKAKIAEEEDIAEEEEEEEEELEEKVEKPAPKRQAVPRAKSAQRAPKGQSKSKTVADERKGQDKISEIYQAGAELLAGEVLEERRATVSGMLMKLEEKLDIPLEELQLLGVGQSARYDAINGLHEPLKAHLAARDEFRTELLGVIQSYESKPDEIRNILDTLDSHKKAAITAGLQRIEGGLDFKAFAKGAMRFMNWN